MTTTIWFLGLGVLLIVALSFLLDRILIVDSKTEWPPKSEEAVVPPEVEVPGELTDRIFGSDDWNFVIGHGSKELKRRFLQERRSLALSWIRTVRASTDRLLELHRTSARSNAQIQPLVELKIAIAGVCFDVFCHIIAVAIVIRGPVGMATLVRRVATLSEWISEYPFRISAPRTR
jgi:hypothetical protein